MKQRRELVTHRMPILLLSGLGDALLIVGIVSAAMKMTIAGFTPMSWFLLAIACYLGLGLLMLARIEFRLESKAGG